MSQTIRRKAKSARKTAAAQGASRKVRTAKARTGSAFDSVMAWVPLSEEQLHRVFMAIILGGAVALATANRVLMLEHSIYTVASPEASASILWRDSARAADAATAMKVTAQDLKTFCVIDDIITEPLGGAHRDPAATIMSTGNAIADVLQEFEGKSREEVRKARQEKFLTIGSAL